jgi:hypothetical protein
MGGLLGLSLNAIQRGGVELRFDTWLDVPATAVSSLSLCGRGVG